MKTNLVHSLHPRRGMAIGIVLMLGLIILVLGFAMISNSGNLLRHTVDAKQRVRSRYAAEAMVALQTARIMEKANQVFGSELGLDPVLRKSIGTGPGEEAEAKFSTLGSKSKPVQELIATGPYQGLKGLKIPVQIQATGFAPGGASTEIDAELKMYQIPIFQFGVFYEGNLEITPGPDMTVGGPVHTNHNAYFRGYRWNTTASQPNVLSIRGPVTVSGKIYQWTSTVGLLRYLKTPEDTSEANYFVVPDLTIDLTVATAAALPPVSAKGVANVAQGAAKLKLPIGTDSAIKLIGPNQPTDPPELTRQKFDAKINCSSGCLNRFVNTSALPPPPPWISTPKYFYDRREQTWVRVWDFDVKAMSSQSNDSIFYLLDTVWTTYDGGAKTVLNAFRIVNGDSLPRNLTIASGNPIYIQGDFNVPQPSGPCHPADAPTPVANEDKYCNAMIAANTVTLLSGNWPKLAQDSSWTQKQGTGSMEFSPPAPWNTATPWNTIPAPTAVVKPNKVYSGTTIRVNVAILTGNKPTTTALLPPTAGSIADGTFESVYEGGWHNTIRFLEDLGGVDMIFRGSFVCLWEANFPGLRTDALPGKPKVFSTDYYAPPNRKWSYDPRFANLNNMPPGTPYLATGVMASWSER